MTSLRRILSRTKVRQSRGGSWVQVIFNMGIITANVALFREQFEKIGLSEIQAIVILCSCYVVGTIVLGFFDERYGIWQYEKEFDMSLNPFMRNIRDAIDKLLQENGKE